MFSKSKEKDTEEKEEDTEKKEDTKKEDTEKEENTEEDTEKEEIKNVIECLINNVIEKSCCKNMEICKICNVHLIGDLQKIHCSHTFHKKCLNDDIYTCVTCKAEIKCAICLDIMEKDVEQTKCCLHYFHSKCIEELTICPMCRFDLSEKLFECLFVQFKSFKSIKINVLRSVKDKIVTEIKNMDIQPCKIIPLFYFVNFFQIYHVITNFNLQNTFCFIAILYNVVQFMYLNEQFKRQITILIICFNMKYKYLFYYNLYVSILLFNMYFYFILKVPFVNAFAIYTLKRIKNI